MADEWEAEAAPAEVEDAPRDDRRGRFERAAADEPSVNSQPFSKAFSGSRGAGTGMPPVLDTGTGMACESGTGADMTGAAAIGVDTTSASAAAAAEDTAQASIISPCAAAAAAHR